MTAPPSNCQTCARLYRLSTNLASPLFHVIVAEYRLIEPSVPHSGCEETHSLGFPQTTYIWAPCWAGAQTTCGRGRRMESIPELRPSLRGGHPQGVDAWPIAKVADLAAAAKVEAEEADRRVVRGAAAAGAARKRVAAAEVDRRAEVAAVARVVAAAAKAVAAAAVLVGRVAEARVAAVAVLVEAVKAVAVEEAREGLVVVAVGRAGVVAGSGVQEVAVEDSVVVQEAAEVGATAS
jgi:hypothetical protein